MATINTESIQGFADMTPEQQVQALLGFEYDDGSEENKRLKAAMDKAASETASYKKQLKEKMSAEEIKQQETDNAIKAMEQKIAEYERRERLSQAKTMLLGSGFEDSLSDDAAAAFISGDTAKFSDALKKFRLAIEAQTKSSLMQSTPKMESGTPDSSSGDSVNTSIAEQIGKNRAESNKKAMGILDSYTRRKAE